MFCRRRKALPISRRGKREMQYALRQAEDFGLGGPRAEDYGCSGFLGRGEPGSLEEGSSKVTRSLELHNSTFHVCRYRRGLEKLLEGVLYKQSPF